MTFLRPALVALSAVALSACKNAEQKTAPASSVSEASSQTRVAEIYFSTSVYGYVEPCGCTSKPLGGIHRLASTIKAGHADRGLIDSGNFLFPKEGLDKTTEAQHLLKSRILTRAYRKLGVLAINLGKSDLAEGRDLLKELQQEGAVPFVSSNVRPTEEGGPAVARSFLREIGGIKFGITGVATPEPLAHVAGMTAIEYTPVLRTEVAKLRESGAEVVIVLADLSDALARDLARSVEGVDVIVRGPGTPITRKPAGPVRVGTVIVTEGGSQGQHIGRMTFRLGRGAPKVPLNLDDAGYSEERRVDLVDRKIKALEREIEEWSKDKAKAAAVESRKAQLKKLMGQRKVAAAPVKTKLPSVRIELVPLTDDVTPDPDTNELLEAYYAQLKDLNKDKGDPSRCEVKDKKAPVYVGTAKCAKCHEEAYEFWKKTKHSKAWETLTDQNKHFDLTCIGCHIVGFETPGGVCKVSQVEGFEDVGCESCHGPGSIHIDDEDPTSIKLEAPVETCNRFCHVPEHSDQFDYKRYILEITGEGHELSEAPP